MYLYTLALVFFFNDTATTEIYTLSLHDAPSDLSSSMMLALWPFGVAAVCWRIGVIATRPRACCPRADAAARLPARSARSEEHTSELQSRQYLVCRLLLEKKNKECRCASYTLCTV